MFETWLGYTQEEEDGQKGRREKILTGREVSRRDGWIKIKNADLEERW